MKRIPRAVKAALAVAAASGVGLATVSAATADTPALCLSVPEGSHEAQVNNYDGDKLMNAATDLFTSLDGVLNHGVFPQIEPTAYAVSFVLGPSSIPGFAEQFALADPSQLSLVHG